MTAASARQGPSPVEWMTGNACHRVAMATRTRYPPDRKTTSKYKQFRADTTPDSGFRASTFAELRSSGTADNAGRLGAGRKTSARFHFRMRTLTAKTTENRQRRTASAGGHRSHNAYNRESNWTFCFASDFLVGERRRVRRGEQRRRMCCFLLAALEECYLVLARLLGHERGVCAAARAAGGAARAPGPVHVC